MKEEFSLTRGECRHQDPALRRENKASRFATGLSVYPSGSGSVVGFLKIIHLDEQSASRRSDLLVQLSRTGVTLTETGIGSLVVFRAVRLQTGSYALDGG
jgi:hypothetical protein